MNGMGREATRVLGGCKTPSVTVRDYNKARSEEVAPEMRGALDRACSVLSAGEFAQNVGLARGP